MKGDTETMITASEHDGGYSLNYEARQNASKLNQAVKTINAFNKRIQVLQLLPKLRRNLKQKKLGPISTIIVKLSFTCLK